MCRSPVQMSTYLSHPPSAGAVMKGSLGSNFAVRSRSRERPESAQRCHRRCWRSHYPDRQIGLVCLPYGDIDDAVTEIHRVAKMGIMGLELSCSWDMEPMWHPVWEPLWNAVEEVQLPLHFHTFPTTSPRAREGVSGQVSPRRDVHRRVGLPDGADQHHRRTDRRRRVGAPPAPPRLFRRERHRRVPQLVDGRVEPGRAWSSPAKTIKMNLLFASEH